MTLNANRDPKQTHRPKLRASAPDRPKRQISVSDLLDGSREVILVYKTAEYRLRVTSNDKIILTK